MDVKGHKGPFVDLVAIRIPCKEVGLTGDGWLKDFYRMYVKVEELNKLSASGQPHVRMRSNSE